MRCWVCVLCGDTGGRGGAAMLKVAEVGGKG